MTDLDRAPELAPQAPPLSAAEQEVIDQAATLTVDRTLKASVDPLIHVSYRRLAAVVMPGDPSHNRFYPHLQAAVRRHDACQAPFGAAGVVIGEIKGDRWKGKYLSWLGGALLELWPKEHSPLMGQAAATKTLRTAHGAGENDTFPVPLTDELFEMFTDSSRSPSCTMLDSGNVVNLSMFDLPEGHTPLRTTQQQELVERAIEALRLQPGEAVDPVRLIGAIAGKQRIARSHVTSLLNIAESQGVYLSGTSTRNPFRPVMRSSNGTLERRLRDVVPHASWRRG